MSQSSASLTLNDLYDATFMTRHRFSNFHWVFTIMQVVHTEFIKVVITEYSAFKSSSKMIQGQAAAAVIIALISKKISQGKREKRRVCVKPCLKRRKNLKFHGTLLAELRLEHDFNYNILL